MHGRSSAAWQEAVLRQQKTADRKEGNRTRKEEDGIGSTAANEEGKNQNWCETFTTNVLLIP